MDPLWMDLLPLIIAFFVAISTLFTNYLLQRNSFNLQKETNRTALRIKAYSSLLGHISNYESLPGEKDFRADMGLYLAMAAVYGSPKIKTLIIPEIEKAKIERSSEFGDSLRKIKDAIIEEIKITKEEAKKKHRYQFWK
jgi:hypothetical protein